MNYPGMQVVFIALSVMYGWFLFVALTNLLFMPREKPRSTPIDAAVLIPARDEEDNLRILLPALVGQARKIYVYDDESSDGTAAVAAEHGAVVLRAGSPPPEGWTGKNRACHALAQAAAEDFSGEWLLFLDADTRPGPEFLSVLGSHADRHGPRLSVLTGFPKFLPGRGVEPVFMGWVTWTLLALNPFGLVALTKVGHNRFLNGQISLWRASRYFEILPHAEVSGVVLEDIAIGRLLARRKIPVVVADISAVLSVKMYSGVDAAWKGMLKNSCDIAGVGLGSWLLAGLLVVIAMSWISVGPMSGWLAASLIISSLFADILVRRPIWLSIFVPVSLFAGAAAILQSSNLRKEGKSTWKGRNVGANRPD